MPDNVLWYIVFSFPFFFPGYSVIESTVACVPGLLSWATEEVLSAATRSTATRKLACIFFLMAILLSGIQCRGYCFIQIKLDNKNKIRYICLLS